jgi:apolipoprotein N-acyltransferase
MVGAFGPRCQPCENRLARRRDPWVGIAPAAVTTARRSGATRDGLAIATTAVAVALYSRFTWPWIALGWVGLVPWLAALDRTRSTRAALVSGLAMAAAFELAVFGWFAPAIATYTRTPTALAAVLLVACGPLLQPQLVTFAVARHVARAAGGSAVLAALTGAAAYVGTEWAVPKLFADTLGYGLHPSVWLRQGADVVGVSGLTFALVLANESVLALVHAVAGRRRPLAPAACLAAILVTLGGYGALRLRALAPRDPPAGVLVAGIVQANLARYDALRAEIGTYEAVRRIVDDHVALSSALLARRRLDLLVWPETVYPTTFGSPKSEEGAAFDREIAAFVAGAGVPLVFGSYDREGADEFNAAVVLEPPGDPAAPLAFDTYRKASLFPLTERVPAFLEFDAVRGWMPWLGTWTPGSGAKVIPIALADGRTVRVAPLVCYDVLAPALVHAAARAGAELFVTLSNDSWFATGEGPHLHLVGAVFRSIETRRPQIRATNTGISAIVTATGDVVATAAVDTRATLAGTVVPDGRTTTVLVAWGDWFGASALVVAVALLAAAARRPARPL